MHQRLPLADCHGAKVGLAARCHMMPSQNGGRYVFVLVVVGIMPWFVVLWTFVACLCCFW